MTEFFALKTGSLRVSVDLVEPVIEVRFRKHIIESLGGMPWYIAQSKDRRECLALFPNENSEKESLDPNADGYEIILYLARSPREAIIKRKIATGTRFRFMESSDRLKLFVERILDKQLGPYQP